MKQDQFSRTRALIGQGAMERLAESHVAIFGLGGVGGHTAEALARSGVGELSLFDDDQICLTNLNRQIIATHKTVGAFKADTMAERILEINPNAKVHPHRVFYGPEVAEQFDLAQYDYVVDAIDTVTAKLELAVRAYGADTPIICAMGTANKLDPTAFVVTDIFDTESDPLARVMRRELRKRGIEHLRVVYSNEPAKKPVEDLAKACRQNCICPADVARTCTNRRQIPASSAFVPGVAGLILAGEVIKALIADV
ncbi:MAG: tRNA threonylcarbamoyladenosine dehydratase [Oscillospiraceae bacterium]|nr:tRNA threonylcarbamoyladenosine dehydratase [Oscillospiraceae bacterium]